MDEKVQGQRIDRSLKRRLGRITRSVMLPAIIALLIAYLTFTDGKWIFLNILLLPALGALMARTIQKHLFTSFAVTFAVCYLLQVCYGLFRFGFDLSVLFSGVYALLTLTYAALLTGGCGLLRLLHSFRGIGLKRSVVRILAAAIVALSVGTVVFFAVLILGEPFTASVADRQIRGYLKNTYPVSAYRFSGTIYNLVMGRYYGSAVSKSDFRYSFTVEFDPRTGVTIDHSESDLAKLKLYYEREQLALELFPILKEVLPGLTHVTCGEGSLIYLSITAEDLSPADIADMLITANRALRARGYQFDNFTVAAQKRSQRYLVQVQNITVSMIESGSLPEILQKAADSPGGYDGESGIFYFTKS